MRPCLAPAILDQPPSAGRAPVPGLRAKGLRGRVAAQMGAGARSPRAVASWRGRGGWRDAGGGRVKRRAAQGAGVGRPTAPGGGNVAPGRESPRGTRGRRGVHVISLSG